MKLSIKFSLTSHRRSPSLSISPLLLALQNFNFWILIFPRMNNFLLLVTPCKRNQSSAKGKKEVDIVDDHLYAWLSPMNYFVDRDGNDTVRKDPTLSRCFVLSWRISFLINRSILNSTHIRFLLQSLRIMEFENKFLERIILPFFTIGFDFWRFLSKKKEKKEKRNRKLRSWLDFTSDQCFRFEISQPVRCSRLP